MKDLTKLLSYLLRMSSGMRFPKLVVLSIVFTGFVSGLATAGLIAVINTFLGNPEADDEKMLLFFVVLVLTLPLFKFVSRLLVIRLTQHSFYTLRMHICRQILATPLRTLEELGPPRILASLAGDVGQISQSIGTLPYLMMHVAVVSGCMVYLGWLSWWLLLELTAVLLLGVFTFRPALSKANVNYNRTRELYAHLFEHFRGLTEGTKELKMHRERRKSFISMISETAKEHRYQVRTGDTLLSGLSSWGEFLFFIAVGLLLFVVPQFQEITLEIKLAFAVTILLMRGPAEEIINAFPNLSRAVIAIRKVEEISESMKEPESVASDRRLAATTASSWQQIDIVGITHTYYREDQGEKFELGPINTTIRPGELLFIVGGNGSGKTTLAKLLAGLYAPETGEIRIDGEEVDQDRLDDYRQLFTVVFSDFFIFESFLGLEGQDADRVRYYLEQLQLQNKVTVENDRLSTVDLSQGQRKRLALLTAYLEDRDIYLFDEWAADQDPQFKGVFYLKLLPELRARGKTVLVISHDDHYYHVADRIIKLDYGAIDFDGPLDAYLEFAPPAVGLQEVNPGNRT